MTNVVAASAIMMMILGIALMIHDQSKQWLEEVRAWRRMCEKRLYEKRRENT